MKRIALLIGSPGTEDHEGYLSGVDEDTQNIYNFLLSPSGGAWLDSEIYYYQNPSRADIVQFIDVIHADYSLTYFSGHGRHVRTRSQREATVLLINPHEEITLGELENASPKQLIITDACRTVSEEEQFIGAITEAIDFSSRLSPMEARRIFDSQLTKSDDGVVVIHSCSVGEGSIEDENGGYYTQSLLWSVQEWTRTRNQYNVLNVNGAFRGSIQYLRDNFVTNQQPNLIGERMLNRFPFAIRQRRIVL